jgi:zinc protease
MIPMAFRPLAARVLGGLAAAILLALPLRAEIAVQEVVSPGGIRAWLVEEPSIPFVALELRFRGGTSLDAPGARGAVNLMTGLLEEGAGGLDAQGFAEAREALAASFGFDADDDALSVSARFLTENRDGAVALLRSALVEPRFDAEALERVRGQVLAGIRSDSQRPERVARTRFFALAFGDHPYGSSGNGTLESVAALTREDIVAAHAGALARDRVHVAAVGDITPADLGRLLDALLGALPATGAPLPGPATVGLEPGVTVVPFGGPQSAILFGHAGIAYDSPDFLTAFVVNEAVGGGRFGTRLMAELREKRGLTYGVGTGLASRQHGALILGSLSVANARVAEAIALIREEWARAAAGLTEAELEAIKTYLTGSYPLRFDGNTAIARVLVGMQMQGMPIDYIATRNDKVRAVTVEDTARVAANLYDPAALHFVVVGAPEGVESGPLLPAN